MCELRESRTYKDQQKVLLAYFIHSSFDTPRMTANDIVQLNRLCPMLNGTVKQDDSFNDPAFGSMGGASAL